MADLHRYQVRMQFEKNVSIDALNEQNAKDLAETDTLLQDNVDFVKTKTATLVTAGSPLSTYDCRVIARRNVIVDALDRQDARMFAESDINDFEGVDAGTLQPQQTIQLQEKTGVT